MSENRVVRRIFGPKRVEGTEGWRKTRNEELQNLYSFCRILRDQIKEGVMGEAHSTDGRYDQCVINKINNNFKGIDW
jgi:hypothetical protein